MDNEKKDIKVVAGRITRSLDPYMLKLASVLEGIEKGDWLLDSKIKEMSGIDNPNRLRSRLVGYFNARGGVLIHRTTEDRVGYYLLTDEEQDIEYRMKTQKQSTRVWCRGQARANGADTSKLPPDKQAIAERLRDTGWRVQNAMKDAMLEVKFILGGKRSRKRIR